MPQVIIENPIINSPFAEPSRHFRFTDEGITDEIVESRRVSSYFVPITRAKTLEEMPAVVSYVKNHHLGFAIPYTIDGEEHQYLPDFIVRLDDGHGPGDLLNLIVEVTGEKRKDKAAKVATARGLWAPAVNNHGGFGRWSFIEIDDPWDAMMTIQSSLQKWTRP